MSLDFVLENEDGEELFWYNITHNLTKMAEEAGVFKILWRPIENGFEKARDIVETLNSGLTTLESNKNHFAQFNAKNEWGTYEDLVAALKAIHEGCLKFPEGKIYSSV